MESKKIQCPHCGAPLIFEPGMKSLVCSYCGSPLNLTEDGAWPEATAAGKAISRILPASLSADSLRGAALSYIVSSDLAPDTMVSEARVISASIIYIPCCLATGSFRGSWSATFGYDRTETYQQWNPATKRMENRTRTVTDWRPASGTLNGNFSFLGAACPLTPEAEEVLKGLDSAGLLEYDARYMTGHSVMDGSGTPEETYRDKIEPLVKEEIARTAYANAQGNKQKGWSISSQTEKKLETVLIPLGKVVFAYQGKEYTVWVDGCNSARFAGDPLPKDPEKVSTLREVQRRIRMGSWPMIASAAGTGFGMFAGTNFSGGIAAMVFFACAAYFFMRTRSIRANLRAIQENSRKIREALATQRHSANSSEMPRSAEEAARIEASYRLPEKVRLQERRSDKIIVPLLTVLAGTTSAGQGFIGTDPVMPGEPTVRHEIPAPPRTTGSQLPGETRTSPIPAPPSVPMTERKDTPAAAPAPAPAETQRPAQPSARREIPAPPSVPMTERKDTPAAAPTASQTAPAASEELQRCARYHAYLDLWADQAMRVQGGGQSARLVLTQAVNEYRASCRSLEQTPSFAGLADRNLSSGKLQKRAKADAANGVLRTIRSF